jgi:hypothetical protein
MRSGTEKTIRVVSDLLSGPLKTNKVSGQPALPPCLYLRVYGERNSGTNYVEQLVLHNFSVTALQSKNRVNDHIAAMGAGMSAEQYGKFRIDIMDIDCERIRQSDSISSSREADTFCLCREAPCILAKIALG